MSALAAVVLGFLVTALARKGGVPVQYVYDSPKVSSVQHYGDGCAVSSWDGMDSDGMAGPPWVSYVNCSSGNPFKAKGVAVNGDFQIWLHVGMLTLNGEMLAHPGESVWIASGAIAHLEIAGAAYIAGAKFELDASAHSAVFTSAYAGVQSRSYAYDDAVNFRRNSSLQHDDHIMNGSSPSKDFVFLSRTGVDPPSVAVLNCGAGSSPQTNFVWSHFHPFGALYLPLSGDICFATDDVVCASPGQARWTSANLQYYEYFRKINVTNPAADAVRAMANVSAAECEYPNLFAVTNFDGGHVPAGVPNFGDWPENAHSNPLALDLGPWGVFPRMTVQATKMVVKTAIVDVDFRGSVELERDAGKLLV